MAVFQYLIPSLVAAGAEIDVPFIYFDQLAIEINAAWTGTIPFTMTGNAVNIVQPHGMIVTIGLLSIDTGAITPDAAEEEAMTDAISAHSANPSFAFTVAAPPMNAATGRVAYLSDCAREGGGAGCPCYFDGTDWRRCSDNAVAST